MSPRDDVRSRYSLACFVVVIVVVVVVFVVFVVFCFCRLLSEVDSDHPSTAFEFKSEPPVLVPVRELK